MRYSLGLIFFAALVPVTFSHAEDSYSAKALFFGADDAVLAVPSAQQASTRSAGFSEVKPVKVALKHKSKVPDHIGVNYFVRLKNPDGTTSNVTATREFKAGERFQLGVKVNSPSYVAILNEDPEGKITQLYPQSGQNSFIDAMGTVFLPAKGAFQFDDHPGNEKLLVYVSQKPLDSDLLKNLKQREPDMINLARTEKPARCLTAENTVSSSDPGYLAKGIAFAADDACSGSAKTADTEYAAKGITFADTDEGQSSYVVKKATPTNNNLYLKINLNHK